MIFAGDDEKLISEIKARAQLRKFADDAMQDGIVISRAGTSAAKQAGDARNKDETDLTHADQVQEDELIGNMRPAEVRRIERDLLRGKLKLDKLTPEESAVVTRMERELKERTEQSKLTEKRLSADKSQTEKKLLMARKAEDAKEQQRIREEKKQEALKAASTASAMDLDVQKLYAVNPEGAINPNSPERLKVMLEKTQEQLIEESLLTVRLENRKRHTDDQKQSFETGQLELLARQREAAAKLAQDQRDAAALTAQMQRDEQVSVLREMERRHEELRRNDEVRQEQELLYAKHLDEQRLAESRRLDLQAEEEKRRART